MSVSLNVKIVATLEGFYALREEWNAINDNSPKGTVFISWEWLYTWWEVYQNDCNRELYILTYHDDNNNLLGIAPFQIINNPKRYFPCSRQLILLGTGETDGSFVFGEYMDLIIQPNYESKVIRAFSDFLFTQLSLWDGAKFHELLDESYLSRLFKNHSETVVKTVTAKGFRTYIELPETYKDYLMSLRKKMRNNITRTFTRLSNEQEYCIDTVYDVSDAEEAIALLAELNRFRRGDMGKGSAFEQANFETFHKKVVKRLLPLNKVSLRILRFENQPEPVAALYSFVDKDIIHPYQSGFETESGHRYSLLTMMLTQEISNSIEDPLLKRFNFMYSDEENTYKHRYSGTTETMYHLSYDKTGVKYTIYRFIHGPIKSWVKKILKID